MPDFDVIVVGAGNAAHAAAFSAHENGAKRVLILEKAPEEDRGGNTHYSGGLLRIAFEETEDLAHSYQKLRKRFQASLRTSSRIKRQTSWPTSCASPMARRTRP